MSGSARTLVVGLDACDPRTVEAMAARGEMPVVRDLLRRGARCAVRNPHGLYVGALWESFATGLSAARHGYHSWDEIEVATYERRLTDKPDEAGPPMWVTASEAGRRVAVLDVPHARADHPIDGVQLAEYACHDRHFGLHSWPPRTAADIEATFGLHPILGVDPHVVRDFAPDDYILREGPLRTPEEEHDLLAGLVAGIEVKRRVSATLLRDGGCDLFITVFGEGHAVGHQLWHLHDTTHARFNPVARQLVGSDPIREVYRELDAAVGDLLSQADEDTTVLVLLSHGMGPHHDGTHLLDTVLRRIDLVDTGASLGGGVRGAAKQMAGRLPVGLRRRATAVATPLVRRLARGRDLVPCPEFVTSAERRSQRFYLEPNNACVGGIRFNLLGREPDGCVTREDVTQLVASLREDLLSLVNVETGGPVVRAVEPIERWHAGCGLATDTMPDLFVEWERSTLINTVWSPKVGVVHGPYANWRTGDHRPDGLLLASGPGIAGGSTLPKIDVTDLAPTILARLGIPDPGHYDGRTRAWLAPPG